MRWDEQEEDDDGGGRDGARMMKQQDYDYMHAWESKGERKS